MITSLIAGQLAVRVFEDRAQLGAAAAAAAADTIRKLLEIHPEINIIFAAAPSQNEFLEALQKQEGISWNRINAFHMDEYIGLPSDAPQGFGNFLKVRLFDLLPFATVNYIRDKDQYAALLQQHPAHVVCMGIGENGHLAFNDPPVADFNDPETVKVVTLDPICRQQQVNDSCFVSLEEVPVQALTLTIPALMKAPYIFCMVPGPTKAQAVYDTLHREVVELYPSTILRAHPAAVLFTDKESAALLNLNGLV